MTRIDTGRYMSTMKCVCITKPTEAKKKKCKNIMKMLHWFFGLCFQFVSVKVFRKMPLDVCWCLGCFSLLLLNTIVNTVFISSIRYIRGTHSKNNSFRKEKAYTMSQIMATLIKSSEESVEEAKKKTNNFFFVIQCFHMG